MIPRSKCRIATVLLLLFVLLASVCKIYGSDAVPDLNLPVVYVVFGEIPMYLRMNIELAARHNDVLVIADSHGNSFNPNSRRRIAYANMDKYMSSARKFEPHYRHMSRDGSAGRKRHELRCIQVSV
jgi:hypothetical protein